MTRLEVAKILAEECFAPHGEKSMAITIFVEAALFPHEVQYTKEMLEVVIYDYLQNRGIYKEEDDE